MDSQNQTPNPDQSAGTTQVPALTVQPAPISTQPTAPSEPTVPMISPNGDIADIPQSKRVDATLKGGYKLGISMVGKDGTEAVIPSDRAQEAIDKGGYKLKDPKQPLTERAMQQSMGGMPMYVDVPVGTKELFERAGRKGYETGAEIGMGTVAAAGGAAAAMPVLEVLAPHLPEIDKVIKIAKALGYASLSLESLQRIMHAIKK